MRALLLCLVAVAALQETAAARDVTVCSGGYGSAACVTRSIKERPARMVHEGVLHYWNPSMRTYCFKNQYGNERCMDKLDVPKLTCGEADGVAYCQ